MPVAAGTHPYHVGQAESRGPDPGGGERSAAHPPPVSGRGGRDGGSRALGPRRVVEPEGVSGLGRCIGEAPVPGPGQPGQAAVRRPVPLGCGGCVSPSRQARRDRSPGGTLSRALKSRDAAFPPLLVFRCGQAAVAGRAVMRGWKDCLLSLCDVAVLSELKTSFFALLHFDSIVGFVVF